MKNVSYSVMIDNGKTGDEQFKCGYTTFHHNLGAVSGPGLTEAGNAVQRTVASYHDPQGALAVTLTAVVDGMTQPSHVYRITDESLGAVEVSLAGLLLEFARVSAQHLKDKAKHVKHAK